MASTHFGGYKPPGVRHRLLKTAGSAVASFLDWFNIQLPTQYTMDPPIENPSRDVTSLFGVLSELKITTETTRYKSPDERDEFDETERGKFCKNLFLKDRKGQFYLVIVEEKTSVDLKELKLKLKAHRNFSFGSAEELQSLLNVKSGCVTPFALMNESACDVRVAIDKSLSDCLLNFHPLHPDYATLIAFDDLENFLTFYSFDIEYI